MITLYITAAMRLYLLHCSLATTPIDSAPALFVSSYHLCPQFTTYAVTESRALKLVPRRWRPGPWPLGGGAAKLSALAFDGVRRVCRCLYRHNRRSGLEDRGKVCLRLASYLLPCWCQNPAALPDIPVVHRHPVTPKAPQTLRPNILESGHISYNRTTAE